VCVRTSGMVCVSGARHTVCAYDKQVRGTAESMKSLILLSEWSITAQLTGEKGQHVVKPEGRVSDSCEFVSLFFY